jgi:subtilisin family serine protease
LKRMDKTAVLLSVCSFFFLFLSTTISSGQDLPDYTPGQLLVKFDTERVSLPEDFSAQHKTGFARLDEALSEAGVLGGSKMIPDALSAKRDGRFAGLYLLELDQKQDIGEAKEILSRTDGVIYAEPNYIRQLYYEPNDTFYPYQWALHLINADEAWDISRGNSTVLIAIIDTGVDYLHPDLAPNIWHNPGETPDNGIDDDGNGYVDDHIGYDFSDAPYWPGMGDYLDRDNDPMDDNGHGTHCSGIAAAAGDNEIGMAGVAFDAKIMAVRAGFSLIFGVGVLEDDDSAAAIIYAADNGADVMNLSWGSFGQSAVIRDAIDYATSKGVTVVAAAGNSAVSELHFPSANDNVISVGAINSGSNLASFSNYGYTVDLVAPGVSIQSTIPTGIVAEDYAPLSGTSMASPHVAGAAGLLIAEDPTLSPEEVRAALRAGARDLGAAGWDSIFGAGALDAAGALGAIHSPVVRINSPRSGSGVTGEVEFVASFSGFATGTMNLQMTAVSDSINWIPLAEGISITPADHILVTTLDTATLDNGEYRFSLTLDTDGRTYSDETQITIDNTIPSVLSLEITNRAFEGQRVNFAVIGTEDPSHCTLEIEQGSNYIAAVTSDYMDTLHVLDISSFVTTGDYVFTATAISPAGLESDYGPVTLAVDADPIGRSGWAKLGSLPGGSPMDTPSDFDGDGNHEVVLKMNDGGVGFFEYESGQFFERSSIQTDFYPLSWGETDNDGKREILGRIADSVGVRSYVYESATSNGFPSQEIAVFDNASGGLLTDELVNAGLVLIFDTEVAAYQNNGATGFSLVQRMVNPTPGDLNFLTGAIAIGDWDNDGQGEILVGDIDGDAMIFERRNGEFEYAWSTKVDESYAIYAVSLNSGANGRFMIGTAGTNMDPVTGGVSFTIFANDGDDSYVPTDTLPGGMAEDVAYFRESPFEGVLAATGSYGAYLFEVELGVKEPFWYSPTDGGALMLGDLDNNAEPEFGFSRNDSFHVYAHESVGMSRPEPPAWLQADVLDDQTVVLRWDAVAGADSYGVYGSVSGEPLELWGTSDSTSYVHAGLTAGDTLQFAVTTYDKSYGTPESSYSNRVDLVMTSLPSIESVKAKSLTRILVEFDRPADYSVEEPGIYSLAHKGRVVTSALRLGDLSRVLLALSEPLSTTVQDTLFMDRLMDESGVAAYDLSHEVQIAQDMTPPCLLTAQSLGLHDVTLTFSEELDPSGADEISSYEFVPPRTISSVEHADSTVHITLAELSALEAPEYTILAKYVQDLAGNEIPLGPGNSAVLKLQTFDLDGVAIYPVPFKPAEDEFMSFAFLPQGATVEIFDAEGSKMIELGDRDRSKSGVMSWAGSTDGDIDVASGVYLYKIETESGETKWGKIAVIR